MAGEDLDQIWRTFCRGKGDLRLDSWIVPDTAGTVCSAQGCHHCTATDCIYASFIRHYRRYPQSD
jgi:hypothetical protein